MAITILLLTVLRIDWPCQFDLKPLPVEGSPDWQERIASWVHVTFYVVVLGMAASGIGTITLSGTAPAGCCRTSPTIPRACRTA